MTTYTIGSEITLKFAGSDKAETTVIESITFADCGFTGWKSFHPVINGKDVMVSDKMRNDLRASFGADAA